MVVIDKYDFLNKYVSPHKKLRYIYDIVNSEIRDVERIAIALYEKSTDVLKTYLSIDQSKNPLSFYETELKNTPGLSEIHEKGLPRVISNMEDLNKGKRHHTKKIGKMGYKSSYTFPMFRQGIFYGFIFFNSTTKNKFNTEKTEIREFINILCHIVTDFIYLEQSTIKTMVAAFRSASTYVHLKDPETGEHLARMAMYVKLIALELAR